MSNNTVPKSITRIHEEWNGYPLKFIILVLITGFIALLLITGILLSTSMAGRGFYLAVLFILVVIFFKFMRSPAITDRTWLIIQFIIKSLRGQTIIAKYTLPDGFLERIIPLKAFHQEGLIEFMDKQYGLMMRIMPARISDDELDDHIAKAQYLVDSLHGNLHMKFYVCSIAQGNVKDMERNVIQIINKEDRSKEQRDHLFSIYHQAHDNKTAVIQWVFYVFLGLGQYNSLEEALIAKKQYFPGFEQRLAKCDVLVIQLKNKETLAAAYRQCITQRGY
jgi:hypothetical protein